MQILSVRGNAATATLSGTTRNIYLDILDEDVRVGDHVIVHAGFAIHKIDAGEARETLRLFTEAGVLAAEAETETNDEIC